MQKESVANGGGGDGVGRDGLKELWPRPAMAFQLLSLIYFSNHFYTAAGHFFFSNIKEITTCQFENCQLLLNTLRKKKNISPLYGLQVPMGLALVYLSPALSHLRAREHALLSV